MPLGWGWGLRMSSPRRVLRAIERCNAAGVPAVLTVHPWELDPDPPRVRLPPRLALRALLPARRLPRAARERSCAARASARCRRCRRCRRHDEARSPAYRRRCDACLACGRCRGGAAAPRRRRCRGLRSKTRCRREPLASAQRSGGASAVRRRRLASSLATVDDRALDGAARRSTRSRKIPVWLAVPAPATRRRRRARGARRCAVCSRAIGDGIADPRNRMDGAGRAARRVRGPGWPRPKCASAREAITDRARRRRAAAAAPAAAGVLHAELAPYVDLLALPARTDRRQRAAELVERRSRRAHGRSSTARRRRRRRAAARRRHRQPCSMTLGTDGRRARLAVRRRLAGGAAALAPLAAAPDRRRQRARRARPQACALSLGGARRHRRRCAIGCCSTTGRSRPTSSTGAMPSADAARRVADAAGRRRTRRLPPG